MDTGLILVRMTFLRVDCAYPWPDLEPTSVTFEPVGLGDDPEAVHAAFSRLLATRDFFEVEAVREPWPVPFYALTVERFVAWKGGVTGG